MIHPKIVLSVVALLPSVMLCAQVAPPKSPSATAEVKSGADDADKLLASWLLAGSKNEGALARIAVRKASDVEVREFAQDMLESHAKLEAELKPFADSDAKVGSSTRVSGRDANAAKGERGLVEASSGRSPAAKGEFDHIALIRELSTRCLQSQVKMLEAKTGADFDQSFMVAQVGLHTQSVIMADVFSGYASSNLRPTLKQAGKTLSAHLEQATTLCKKCEGGAKVGSKPLNGQK
jgi:predicted outer membrane protein